MKLAALLPYSKVARRILGLFVVCALLPITALTLISFRQVTRQLREDSRQQLRQFAKTEGMTIYERLDTLETQMVQLAVGIVAEPGRSKRLSPDLRHTSEHFRSLAIFTGRYLQPLFRDVGVVPTLSTTQMQHLATGRSLLLSYSCRPSAPCVRMLRYIEPDKPGRGLLIAEPNLNYVFGADTLPPATSLCVLNETRQAVFCQSQNSNLTQQAAFASNSVGNFEWQDSHQEYLAGYWTLTLKPGFLGPQWTVILSKSREDILAVTRDFGRTLRRVIVLSLLVVVLLTLIQVRRTMVPLQKLQEATQQIADRRFDTRVEVSSNVEFQQLATDFNQMAHDLGKQFRALETVREIDRALLSSLSSAEIVKTALHRLRGFLPYQGISVTLLGDSPAADCLTYITTDQQNSSTSEGAVPLTLEEIDELQHETLRRDLSHTLRSYLAALVEQGMKWFLVVPIRHEHRLLGVLSLGNPTPPLETSDDRLYAKQVGDQLALGLSRARLIEELAKLNLGTLTALARAIDAKSEWTSGHSERVTKMAIEIGRVMGLPQEQLLILHRGGLLHDIGKIGTPHQILDKPGKLTDEEFRVMREHVTTGARILEPIPGFTELIPIVLQHHEKFDGSGYPAGLAGEAISLHARIFAVADVNDALISDRPYRPGWQKERVVTFIREQAGTHFDPKVVDAFLRLMSNRSDAAPSAEDEASQTAEDPNLVGTVYTKGRAE